ncbi:hypothetical protein HMPREF1869_01803 [Bacteroidales bacterium KA00251]|nr:hypothetical protein HMPREF1869_01803 [Bacteroidales bacterium KA00251]
MHGEEYSFSSSSYHKGLFGLKKRQISYSRREISKKVEIFLTNSRY